ncbi:hypothetical protein [Marinobacter sp.]|uniref:hypothetical protein n=1 Tax=Marinobacter sp. TaxID=50741 RepID=UPI0035C7224C
MNTQTEILQIVNLALMVNALGGHQVVVNFGGESAHFCAFIYPKGSHAPVDYLHCFIDQPESHLKLWVIRQQMETLLENEEARIKKVAA